MGELHIYTGGTAGNRDGTLLSEDNSNSNPFNIGTLAINEESAVQALAFRAGLGRQTQVPPVFKGDPHFNWSLDGTTFAGYGVDLTYNSIAGDTNKLIRLKVKALPGDSGQISPQMIIDAVQAMIDIPPAPSLSVPVIAASSPAYNVLRVNTPTPAYSNIGAVVTYEDYVDGVLIGSGTGLVRDYNILAGTYAINTIAKDITNSLQQASNTVTGVSVANPPVNQAPVISAPVVYSLGSTSVVLQYAASDDVGITAHQYSLGGVYFSDGVIENIGGGQYRLTINNLAAGTNYPNVTVKVLDAGGLSAIGTVSGGFTTSAAPANVAPTFSLNPRLKANSTTYSGGNYTWVIEFGLNTQSPGVLADVNGDVITVSKCLAALGYTPPDTSYSSATPTYNATTGLWEISHSFAATPNVQYDFWVRLEDISHTGASGNHAFVTITANVPPSVPTGLSATNKTKTGFRLSWNAATDPDGNNPLTYKVFKNGALYQSGVSNTYLDITDQGVNSTATWTVSVVDAQTNESAQSTGLPVTTLLYDDINQGVTISAPVDGQEVVTADGSHLILMRSQTNVMTIPGNNSFTLKTTKDVISTSTAPTSGIRSKNAKTGAYSISVVHSNLKLYNDGTYIKGGNTIEVHDTLNGWIPHNAYVSGNSGNDVASHRKVWVQLISYSTNTLCLFVIYYDTVGTPHFLQSNGTFGTTYGPAKDYAVTELTSPIQVNITRESDLSSGNYTIQILENGVPNSLGTITIPISSVRNGNSNDQFATGDFMTQNTPTPVGTDYIQGATNAVISAIAGW